MEIETKIYKRLSPTRKIQLVSNFYLLGEKLFSLNDRRIYDYKIQRDRKSRRIALRNS